MPENFWNRNFYCQQFSFNPVPGPWLVWTNEIPSSVWHNQVRIPDVVPVHSAPAPTNPGPKRILFLKSSILGHFACHLTPPADFKTTSHRTFRPPFCILHLELPLCLLLESSTWFSYFYISLLYFSEIYIFTYPYIFPRVLAAATLNLSGRTSILAAPGSVQRAVFARYRPSARPSPLLPPPRV